jgi:hypothetical protein
MHLDFFVLTYCAAVGLSAGAAALLIVRMYRYQTVRMPARLIIMVDALESAALLALAWGLPASCLLIRSIEHDSHLDRFFALAPTDPLAVLGVLYVVSFSTLVTCAPAAILGVGALYARGYANAWWERKVQ